MRVNEIFYSLQGEGRHAGTPAVFLRLAGCNLACPFCDTRHESWSEMSEEQIVERVGEYAARCVVVTGGEPLVQLTASLVEALHGAGRKVHLETNGTLPLPEGARPDWVTCSPKDGRMPCIQQVDELKVVYWGQDVSAYERMASVCELRLQPLDTGDEKRNKEIREQTIAYILTHPIWKLSLQTHKMLGLR